MSENSSDAPDTLELAELPGHLLRRAQQVHTSLWTEGIGSDLTGPQFAVLTTLWKEPGLDQGSLGVRISLDRSTMADVARRLEERGWIRRVPHAHDRRRRLLQLTSTGQDLVSRVTPRVDEVERELLAEFSADEKHTLLRLLTRLTETGERRVAGPVEEAARAG